MNVIKFKGTEIDKLPWIILVVCKCNHKNSYMQEAGGPELTVGDVMTEIRVWIYS